MTQTTTQLIYPNAKFNLGLRVLARRADGFHNLETIFIPLSQLVDTIEVSILPGVGEFSLAVGASPLLGDLDSNLLTRAYELLRPYRPPSCRVSLRKAIPIGAGLGGGSADGAFFLAHMAPLCEHRIPEKTLSDLALALGSDCPFFLRNRPAIGFGRGEKLFECPPAFQGLYLVLLTPPIHIPTAWAFSQIRPASHSDSLSSYLSRPHVDWQSAFTNDFQPVIAKAFPVVDSLLDLLSSAGAFYTALSGTGPTVYGLFELPPSIPPEQCQGVFFHSQQI